MCCGRNANSMASTANRVYTTTRPAPQSLAPTQPPEFEYTGATALTVVSPITGRKYRFAQPGARMKVGPVDRSWVAFVPHLRRCM